MNEKILDFQKIKEEMPIDPETILKRLHSVPEDVMEEYITAVTKYVEDLFLLKTIVSSISSPHLCRHLIDGLNPTQLIKLNKISLGLAAEDPLKEINSLIEATFSLVVPTIESRNKANTLVNKLKSLDIDYDFKSKEFAALSRQTQLLSNICWMLGISREFGELMSERLSLVSEDDLDCLIEMGKSL